MLDEGVRSIIVAKIVSTMASLSLLTLSVLLACLTLVESQRYEELFGKVIGQYESRGAKHTIPITSEKDVVHVNVSMSFIQIQSLDTETGDAVLEVWLGFYWRDGRLRWKPGKFGGIKQLNVPSSFIWKPDIVLYNGNVRSEEGLAVLKQDGSILLMPKATITTRCNTTTDGRVTCVMKFGSWTYSGLLISPRVAHENMMLTNYIPGSYFDWEVVKTEAKRRVTYFSCCPEPYPDLTFTLVFKQTTSSWFDFY